jgi:hypothetical protein
LERLAWRLVTVLEQVPGFPVEPVTLEPPTTPLPDEATLQLLRTEIDPTSARLREF